MLLGIRDPYGDRMGNLTGPRRSAVSADVSDNQRASVADLQL
jgi:hypothetical protein